MKFIKRLITFLIVLVVLISGIGVASYFYVKSTYGIDLLSTANEIKILTEEVDEGKICYNAFSEEDMIDVQKIVNESVEELITYSKENGYKVEFDNLPENMKYIIKLTDKQVGSLADTIIRQETNGKVEISGKELSLELKQVDFSNVNKENVTFNTVIALDITPYIEQVPNEFPFKKIKSLIPEVLYISSTFDIIKGEEPFEYSLQHKSFTINNLNTDETADLFNTLDKILKIGTAENLNLSLASVLTSALIGNENNKGLAYSLKEIGATNYSFITDNGIDYFAVKR